MRYNENNVESFIRSQKLKKIWYQVYESIKIPRS
jgi:hypothetical protein